MRRLREEEEGIYREGLMKPDWFSKVVLPGSAELIFLLLLLIVVTALTRA